MDNRHIVPDEIRNKYEIHEWRNAIAVLATSYPEEWDDIVRALRSFQLLRSDVVAKGGSKSLVAKALDSKLFAVGWVEKQFDTKIVVDGQSYDTPTHKVDCVKNRIALEVEWNNKDPFFDRDLNNFRLLFELKAIDVGVIVTRSSELQIIFNQLGKGSSYGNSTTHISKLLPRIDGGGGGGCPLVVFGITRACYVEN